MSTETKPDKAAGPEDPRSSKQGLKTSVAGSQGSLREVGGALVNIESNTVLGALILLVIIVGVIHPAFFTFNQLTSVVQTQVYVGILAIGMAFLICMREIDLSIGGTFDLCLVLAAVWMKNGMDPWLAALLAVLVGCACGFANSILTEIVGLHTIIATLVTMSIFGGLALTFADGNQVVGFNVHSSFFNVMGGNIGGTNGLPTAVPILAGTAIVFTIVLRFLPFGYRVRAIGSNPEAALFSGIRVRRVRMQTLTLMGGLCGLAALLCLGYTETGDPNYGTSFPLTVIAAAIIGGTPLRGGTATVLGAVFGALLLGVVNAGLAFFNVSTNSSLFFYGVVVLFAVALDSVLRARRRGRERRVGL